MYRVNITRVRHQKLIAIYSTHIQMVARRIAFMSPRGRVEIKPEPVEQINQLDDSTDLSIWKIYRAKESLALARSLKRFSSTEESRGAPSLRGLLNPSTRSVDSARITNFH